MDDFSQMLELVAQQLKGSDSALRVERAYPAKLRGNPQCEKLAVIGIQKVKLEPVGLQNFYGGQTLPLGRQATVWVKVSFCCKSGEDCWKLWERCAQGMLFSQQLKLSQIECGKAGLSVQTLLSLCTILEVNPNYILLSDITGQTDPISDLLRGLSPRQLQDAEELLRLFVRNCASSCQGGT